MIRYSSLVRRTALVRRTPLRPVSKKRQRQRLDYEQACAVVWKRDLGLCQPGIWLGDCAGPIDPHHVFTQARWPERRCDPEAMVLSCRRHHTLIHDNPAWAKRAGWLK